MSLSVLSEPYQLLGAFSALGRQPSFQANLHLLEEAMLTLRSRLYSRRRLSAVMRQAEDGYHGALARRLAGSGQAECVWHFSIFTSPGSHGLAFAVITQCCIQALYDAGAEAQAAVDAAKGFERRKCNHFKARPEDECMLAMARASRSGERLM